MNSSSIALFALRSQKLRNPLYISSFSSSSVRARARTRTITASTTVTAVSGVSSSSSMVGVGVRVSSSISSYSCRRYTMGPSAAATAYANKDDGEDGDKDGKMKTGGRSTNVATVVGDGLLNLILYDELPQVLKDDVQQLTSLVANANANANANTPSNVDNSNTNSDSDTKKTASSTSKKPFFSAKPTVKVSATPTPSPAMLAILSLASSLRYLPFSSDPSINARLKVFVENKIRYLDHLFKSEGTIEDRERFYCAALVARSTGDFTAAARILESWLDKVPSDVAALRLAQDYYLDSGDAKNVFSCVTMCWLSLMEQHQNHGNVMGMLGSGLLERGNLEMAEESLNQSIGFSKQMDLFSIHSLMNMQITKGQGSSVLSLYEMSCDEHSLNKDVYGKHMLRFNLAKANVLIGNFSRSVSIIDDMAEAFNAPDGVKTVHSLALMSSALWYTSLWHMDVEVALRFRSKEFLDSWMVAMESQGQYFTPWHMTCAMLAVSGAVAKTDDEALQRRLQQIISTHQYIEDIQKEETDKSSVVSWFRNAYKKIARKEQVPLYTHTVADFDFSDPLGDLSSKSSSSSISDSSNSSIRTVEQYFNKLVSSTSSSVSVDVTSFDFGISEQQLVRNDFRLTSVHSSRQQFIDKLASPLFSALLSYARGNFQESSDKLLQLRPLFYLIGGPKSYRDVIEITLHESLIRSGHFAEARKLLCDRTAEMSNDSESWARLERVYRAQNLIKAADTARYTAYQLGFKQGSFDRKKNGAGTGGGDKNL